MSGCTRSSQSSQLSQHGSTAAGPQVPSGPSVWSVDLMTVRVGERESYRRRTLIDGKATRELTERAENRWFVQLLGQR